MAADVGLIKVSKGSVLIQRGGEKLSAAVGSAVQPADVIVTGADGSAGVTFTDNSLVSVGPNSVFAIDKYSFDTTTHVGEFEGNLKKGRLAAISGKMVRSPPAARARRRRPSFSPCFPHPTDISARSSCIAATGASAL
jgi:hypothetical protein